MDQQAVGVRRAERAGSPAAFFAFLLFATVSWVEPSAWAAPLSCPAQDDGVFASDLPTTSNSAGSQLGAFTVGHSGEALYRYPIVVPPGRGGVQPHLAVVYNSTQRWGLFGVGATLEGLSQMARCPLNMSDDGQRRGVHFDSSDAFCLDGARLVPINSDSSEFRTEPDSFRKIVALPNPSDPSLGPLSFIVYVKDGTIDEYGGRVDSDPVSAEASSRVMANGGVVSAWNLSRRSDRFGNFMTVSYNNVRTRDGDGDYTAYYSPDTIAYTGHEAPGSSTVDLEPQKAVKFTYQAAGVNENRFVRGMRLYQQQLVQSIEVDGPTSMVRHYDVVYQPVWAQPPGGDPRDTSNPMTLFLPSSQYPRLETITEYAADGSARSPLAFAYHGGYNADDDEIAIGDLFLQHETSLPRFDIDVGSQFDHFILTADITGDGSDDVVSFTAQFSSNGNSDGKHPVETHVRCARQPTVTSAQARKQGGAISMQYDGPLTFTGQKIRGAWPLDYDQDGLTDVVYVEDPNTFQSPKQHLKVLKSNGAALMAPEDTGVEIPDGAPPFLADIDGDGVPDLVTCDTKHWEARLWTKGAQPYATPISIPAFDGFDCNLGDRIGGPDPSTFYVYQQTISNVLAIDLDGDGADEIILQKDLTNTNAPLVAVSWDGKNKAFGNGVPLSINQLDLVGFRTLDVNGDGLRDIVSIATPGKQFDDQIDLKVLVNAGNGKTFKEWPAPFDSVVKKDYFESIPLDTNNDGRVELFMPAFDSFQSTRRFATWGLDFHFGNPSDAATSIFHLGFDAEKLASGSIRPLASATSPANVVYEDFETGTLKLLTNLYDPFMDVVTGIEDQPRAVAHPRAGHPETVDPRIQVQYAPLLHPHGLEPHGATGEGYLGDAGCQYPLVCPRNWRPLVSHYTVFDGADAVEDYGYRYRGGRFDRLGRGWLGFDDVQLVTSDSVENWQYDNTNFDTDKRFTKAGLPLVHSFEAVTGSTKEALASGFTYTRESRIRANGAETFSYLLTQRIDTRISHSNLDATTQSGTPVSVTTTTFVPHTDKSGITDEAGNIGEITTTTQGMTRKLDTTFEYGSEDTNKWLLGLPTRVKSTSTDQAIGTTTSSQTRGTTIVYQNGAPQHITIAPGDLLQQLDSVIDRDAFGNVVHVSTSGTENGASVSRETCATYGDAESMFPTIVGNGAQLFSRTKFDPSFGTPLQSADPNGLVTLYGYDGFGRISKVQRPSGASTTITLSEVDNPNQLARAKETLLVADAVDSNGGTAQLTYDYAGRVVNRVTVPVGAAAGVTNADTWGYDRRGRLAFRILGSDVTSFHLFQYDGFGRPTGQMHGFTPVSAITYDGLSIQIVDAKQSTTVVTTDAAGRTISVKDAGAGVTTYAYGPFDALSSVLDPVGQTRSTHARTWTHSAYGLVTAANDPDRGLHLYSYSAFGLLTQEVGPVVIKNYTYDPAGRPKRLTDLDGTTTWTWDGGDHAKGKLSKLSGPDATTSLTYAYDALSRLHSVTTASNAMSAALTYGYDDANGHDRLTTITYPSSAGGSKPAEPFVVNYDYDDQGHVVKASSASVAGNVLWKWVTGDDQNRVASDEFGAGAISRTRKYSHAFDERLESIQTNAGTSVLQALSFAYDANDNLSSRSDGGGWAWKGKTGAPHQEAFCYDSLDRLTKVDLDGTACTGVALKVAYDADGNITSKSDVGSYRYDLLHPHAVASAGTGIYGYDLRGNQNLAPNFQISLYSSKDLPLAVLKGLSPIGFLYDGFGKRVVKAATSAKTFYASDLYEKVVDSSAGQTTHKYYVPTPAGRVAVVVRARKTSSGAVVGTDSVQYLLTDHLGSIDVVSDGTGGTVERRSYDAFGKRRGPFGSTLVSTGAADPLFDGFAGHEEDTDLGLVNMRGRMYDPKVGRFANADPFTAVPFWSQSWNRYSYAMNNPLSWVDPSGFDTVENFYPGDAGFQGGPADDMEVVYTISNDSSFSGNPVESWTLAPSNLGWGDLSKVDAKPMAQAFNTAMANTVQKDAEGATKTLAMMGTYAVSLPLATGLAIIGVFNPAPANAPTPGFQPLARPSTVARALEVGLPAAVGVLGALGGGGFEAGIDVIDPVQAEVLVSTEAAGGIEATAGAVASTEARVGQTVYRVWGGGARPWGASWTRVDPRAVAGFRNMAGLPGANAGRFVSAGRLLSTEGVQVRGALSLEGNIGGLDELLIPNAEAQIELEFVGGANPEF